VRVVTPPVVLDAALLLASPAAAEAVCRAGPARPGRGLLLSIA